MLLIYIFYCMQLMVILDVLSFLVATQAVLNTLSIGASLLLPPLRERTELLLSLLPQGPQSLNILSKGQVCLSIIKNHLFIGHIVIILLWGIREKRVQYKRTPHIFIMSSLEIWRKIMVELLFFYFFAIWLDAAGDSLTTLSIWNAACVKEC